MTLIDPDSRPARAASLAAAFAEDHDGPPTVVAAAPGRVNLIGEHTDYNHGLCLPLALPHATWAAVRLREDGAVRIASAQRDDPWTGSIDTLGPGQARGWASYAAGVIWALGEEGFTVPGLDLRIDSTVPFGAGLSSSAALECSVGVAVLAALGRDLDDTLRSTLIRACIRAETEVARAPTGGMDQTVAVLGRAGHAVLIDFGPPDAPLTEQVALDLDGAELALLVTDTRVSHALVDGGYGDRRTECDAAAEQLGVANLRLADLDAVEGLADDALRRRARHIVTENDRVRRTAELLAGGDWGAVGEQMLASHASMRDDFEISCAELDLAVETAAGAGALGARMTGGGFGGSSVALVRRTAIPDVVSAIDAAFAAAGFAAPGHLDALPSAGAGVVPAAG